MLELTAGEREYLTEMRSLGTDARGREILVGLSVEESRAYIEHANSQMLGKHASSDESDSYLELHEKHERARLAVVFAEVDARNDKSPRH